MKPPPLALVTGGKRRLGARIAERLAAAGYDLALVSHLDKDPEPELVAALHKAGVAWTCFTHNLTHLDPSPLISAVIAQFGRAPEVLVNNAAMFGQDDWESMTAETLQSHFQLNVFSPLLLTQAVVQSAEAGCRPAIINILDQRIVNPHRDQLSYTLSKQALAGSVRSMAASLGARARVNAVAPGLVISTDDYTPKQEQRLAGMMPLGTLPAPSGVADAVVYLAQAQDVTGQTIFVDGGAHLKSFDRDFMHL